MKRRFIFDFGNYQTARNLSRYIPRRNLRSIHALRGRCASRTNSRPRSCSAEAPKCRACILWKSIRRLADVVLTPSLQPMKYKSMIGSAATLALLGALAACGGVKLQRVPPGQSIRKHLGGAEAPAAGATSQPLPSPAGVDLPTPATAPQPTAGPGTANANFAGRVQPIGALPPEALPPLPITGLPERNDSIERASETYNRGAVLMRNGQNREAVAAFEETTQLDPTFSDAWTQLTVLYEKIGQPDKAREAFRRAKGLSAQPERLSTPMLPPVNLPAPPATPPATPPAAPVPLPPPSPLPPPTPVSPGALN